MYEEFCCVCGEELDESGKCSVHGKALDELNYCPYCGEKYADEDFITAREHEEFWGAPCSYEIIIGVRCSYCGETIDI